MNSGSLDVLMNLLVPTGALGVAVFLLVPTLYVAVRHAPWRQLWVPEQLNVFLGASVSLFVLWHIRTHLGLGIEFHLLGITAVTLVLGWSLAIIAAILAQFGLALHAPMDWSIYPVAIVANGIVPVAVTELVHRLARRKLPCHFFVYIFVGAFLGGALAMVASRLALVAYSLAGGGADGSVALISLAYLPLMALPEALLNGMLMTLLVAYRPQWVSTFSDACYLQGK